MIAALLLIGMAAAEPSYDPIVTTIRAVRAHPNEFQGKLIRVRGWINRCEPLSCSIDERRSDGTAQATERISIATDQTFDSLVHGRTPVRVVVDAAFNPCLENEVCLDRVPELTIVRATLDPAGDALPTKD